MKCFESFAKSIQQQIVVHFCSNVVNNVCIFCNFVNVVVVYIAVPNNLRKEFALGETEQVG